MANGTTYQKAKSKPGKDPKVKDISKKKYERLSKRYSKKGGSSSVSNLKETGDGFVQKETRSAAYKTKKTKKGTKSKVVSKVSTGPKSPVLYRESIPLGKTPKIPTR